MALAELKEAFFLFDYDRDGKITVKEIKGVVRSAGLDATEAEFAQIIREVERSTYSSHPAVVTKYFTRLFACGGNMEILVIGYQLFDYTVIRPTKSWMLTARKWECTDPTESKFVAVPGGLIDAKALIQLIQQKNLRPCTQQELVDSFAIFDKQASTGPTFTRK